MPSGGARSRSGSPPDPNALRRSRDAGDWVVLPAEGRSGPAPKWPLVGQSPREAELWEMYWRKPQAVLWERDGLAEVVALFVRQFGEAEQPRASAENRKTVRMMFADLYLTTDSLLRARLKIAPSVPQAAEVERPVRESSRGRLKVVDGGAA